MCKYDYKTEKARFGMRAAIAKQVRGDAAPRRRRKLCFLGGLLSQSARLCRYGSSSQKVLRYFLGALFVRFSVFDSVRIAGRVLVSAPARGSARVTGRRQPPRQRSRRLVSKTSTRLALTPVYLPYINRIFGVNCYFGAKTLRFTAIRKCLSGIPFKARKCR